MLKAEILSVKQAGKQKRHSNRVKLTASGKFTSENRAIIFVYSYSYFFRNLNVVSATTQELYPVIQLIQLIFLGELLNNIFKKVFFHLVLDALKT